VKLTEHIRFRRSPLAGIDAMAAATTRTFPRHTHDQYGMGVVDSGGHASSSDRGPVEAGPGFLRLGAGARKIHGQGLHP